MFHQNARPHSIKEVLNDKAGNGIAEGLTEMALILVAASMLTLGVTGSLGAAASVATKAERQSVVTSLVGNKHEGATWGTPEAPSSQTITLPNGHDVDVTTWREETPTAVRLTAVSPTSSDPDAADCSGPSDVARAGCIYASRLHAAELDALEPHAVVRKDPSMGSSPSVGTVDGRVATDAAIPQGTTFATGLDDTATVWRYLVTARSLEAQGEIRITQAGKTLAQFPVEAIEGNYFGTLTTDKNVPVTATVTSGNVVVQTVYFYRAGSTS